MILTRRLVKNFLMPKKSYHSDIGYFGQNIPFQVENRFRFFVTFWLYLFTGSAYPWLNLRLTLARKQAA